MALEKILSEVKYKDRKEALKQKKGKHKKPLPFVKLFQPSLPNLKSILIDKWHLIQNLLSVTRTFIWVVTISRVPTDRPKNSGSRAQILANPASQRAVKSRIPSRYFAFSRISHRILAKSRIPRIPFQTLIERGESEKYMLNVPLFRFPLYKAFAPP